MAYGKLLKGGLSQEFGCLLGQGLYVVQLIFTCDDNLLEVLFVEISLRATFTPPNNIKNAHVSGPSGNIYNTCLWQILTHVLTNIGCWISPQAKSHLHLAGPCSSHASFIAQSFCPHVHGNSSSLGTNVIILGRLRH